MEPRMRSLDGDTGNFHGVRRNSPKAKPAVADRTSGGENEASEKLADPIRVYSEKELTKEMDKIANMLAPEQDWSIRMSAMQRLEGLVHGGASEYPAFPSLIKHLVGPLSVQLSDRRSSIVKQACQLLNVLSKELLADFESCAESFIPVLFKLVVITVLVIAESADTCIKTMLRNCRVMRVLPRIIDCAKNDRSPVLRARCCEYALLILEQWANSSEIQRSVDIYEDLIKCCVGDAMSEVRSTARACYRVFAKYWPDRGHRLYVGFDAVIQRLINEEEGGGILQKRHSSPLVRERAPANQVRQSASYQASAGIIMQSTGGQQQQMSSFSAMPVIAMDKNSSLISVSNSASSGSLLHAFRKPTDRGPERTLESVLQASQQKVNAIEAMLKGTDISNKGNISSTATTTTTSSTSASLNTKDQGGSYRKLHATVATGRSGVDPPSARDPPHPASVSILSQASHYSSTSSYLKGGLIGMEDATSSLSGSQNDMHPTAVPSFSAKRVPVAVTGLDRVSQSSSNDEMHDYRPYQRVLKSDQSDAYKNHANNSIPSFQRPLLRAAVSARSSGSSWSSLEETPLPVGESFNQTDGLTSLHDALTEGLSANADWSTRVAAFNYLRKLLQQQQQGARGGIQEVAQCFEKTMKLFSVHLDDPHHKVALAALSTLAEIIPAFRKPFDAYLERILPHVFARLVDPKEAIRHMSTSALDVIANTYSIESLLPALLRSLDEQRSPKAKVAVIEFSINIFAKLAVNGEGGSGGNLLKLWLAKLTPLVHCKNPKLKETAVSCIVSVYSHFDSTAVLNFILGLSIEEQTSLRRALKQYTPRIEVDLINFLQSRNQKAKSSKIIHDQVLTLNTEDDYASTGRFNSFIPKNQYGGGYTTMGSVNSDGGRKQSSHHPDSAEYSTASSGVATKEEKHRSYFPNYEVSGQVEDSLQFSKGKDGPVKSLLEGNLRRANSWSDHNLRANQSSPEQRNGVGSNMAVQIDSRQALDNEQHGHTIGDREFSEIQMDFERSTFQPSPTQNMHTIDSLIPDLLNQLCSNDDKITVKKQEAFDKIVELSRKNEAPLWSKFHNQILAGLLELADKSDPSIREHALSTILELLTNQKQFLEDTVEILLEKFLHCSKDLVATVLDVADRCLNMILAQYDAHRCLTVIVPLLASEDEKTLVCCISSLTKLVSRFPSEELMAQLPSFLPALFDAFGNQSADVRKTVVFCLVDIYIVLGKAFLPYLGSLSGTQLRLVTIYANRISQARSGTPLDVGPS